MPCCVIVTGSVGSALCNEPCPTDICADVYLKSTAGKMPICAEDGSIIPQGLVGSFNVGADCTFTTQALVANSDLTPAGKTYYEVVVGDGPPIFMMLDANTTPGICGTTQQLKDVAVTCKPEPGSPIADFLKPLIQDCLDSQPDIGFDCGLLGGCSTEDLGVNCGPWSVSYCTPSCIDGDGSIENVTGWAPICSDYPIELEKLQIYNDSPGTTSGTVSIQIADCATGQVYASGTVDQASGTGNSAALGSIAVPDVPAGTCLCLNVTGASAGGSAQIRARLIGLECR